MSLYYVRVVGPAGSETWLTHGREVGTTEAATVYDSPSSAQRAADSYEAKAKKRWPVPPIVEVISARSMRDGE